MNSIAFDSRQFEIAHHLDCGIALMRCNRQAQAVLEFETVLQLNPVNPYARWNRSLALLSIGDYVRGMPEHDWAWEIYDWRALGPVKGNVDRILKLPVWKGERCRLIAFHEMGNGDAIMCLRFLSELASRCESVTLVVRPELVSLMEEHGVTVVDTVPQEIRGQFDRQVTFFNSIHTMGYSRETVPNLPYIDRGFEFSGGKVGIAWSGNSQYAWSQAKFLSFLKWDGFELYAMQLPTAGDDPDRVHPLTSKSFSETADLMAQMDHVVTVDTAAAHLAGAMGHPSAHAVIPYLRDWRWYHKDVWYPTLNIYPQDDPADWDAPFEGVNKALRAS